jgi:hypothetical protein
MSDPAPRASARGHRRAARRDGAVRVDHGAEGLHEAVRDVEGHDGHQEPALVEEQHAGLAVDLGPSQRDAALARVTADTEHEAPDAVAADDRVAPGRARAVTVAVHDPVGREHVDEAVHVTFLDRVEEAFGERLAAALAHYEPGSMHLEITGEIAEGEKVVVQRTSRPRTRAGRPYESSCIRVFTIRDGRIRAVREYMDTLYARDTAFG